MQQARTKVLACYSASGRTTWMAGSQRGCGYQWVIVASGSFPLIPTTLVVIRVADHAMHPRTLQRQLATEGVCCQDFIERERQNHAARYLAVSSQPDRSPSWLFRTEHLQPLLSTLVRQDTSAVPSRTAAITVPSRSVAHSAASLSQPCSVLHRSPVAAHVATAGPWRCGSVRRGRCSDRRPWRPRPGRCAPSRFFR
jgi:AraC-like DNA-binding protein